MGQSYDETPEEEQRRICGACIGEPYLKAHVTSSGESAECKYCDETGPTITLGDLADLFEMVFRDHFQRTSNEPESWQATAQNDPVRIPRDREQGFHGMVNSKSTAT